MQIDFDILPDDPAVLRQMLRDVVAAGHQQQAAVQGAGGGREAEHAKLRLLIPRLLRRNRKSNGSSAARPGPGATMVPYPRICRATRW